MRFIGKFSAWGETVNFGLRHRNIFGLRPKFPVFQAEFSVWGESGNFGLRHRNIFGLRRNGKFRPEVQKYIRSEAKREISAWGAELHLAWSERTFHFRPEAHREISVWGSKLHSAWGAELHSAWGATVHSAWGTPVFSALVLIPLWQC